MSKIDPIFVYNGHKSPVSALCIGSLDKQSIIVTGSVDGELHVWELDNFTNLIKIQVHHSKILNLESFNSFSNDEAITTIRDDKEITMNTSLNTGMNTVNTKAITSSDVESRFMNESRFLSQEKDGKMKFIKLSKEKNKVISEVYNELRCSNCTFCQFQQFTISNYLIIIYISTESNNSISLLIMNVMNEQKDEPISSSKKIVELDKKFGMINSMRINRVDDCILLLVGTETGHLLTFTSQLLCDGSGSINLNMDLIGKFSLNSTLECFRDVFISAIEFAVLDRHLEVICGSMEDCLAIVIYELRIDKLSISHLLNTSKPTIKYLKLTNKGITSIMKRSDNKLFATSGSDSRLRLFSLKSLNPLAVLNFHKQTIEMIKFSTYLPNRGYLLAAAGQDKLVTIWSIYN